jgi:hypothetical protein
MRRAHAVAAFDGFIGSFTVNLNPKVGFASLSLLPFLINKLLQDDRRPVGLGFYSLDLRVRLAVGQRGRGEPSLDRRKGGLLLI